VLSFRVIARLDVKGPNLIKGYQFEGLRVLGDPATFARRYADEGADEILYLDTVASLYGRSNIVEILEATTAGVFVPITVGGGVRSEADVRALLNAGADKVALNTAAIADPQLISRCAGRFGSQAIVVSIEAKRNGNGWEAYTDQGRNRTGIDARAWAAQAVALGAGEILLTSIDRDGTGKGPDIGLALGLDLDVPIVLAGGITSADHAIGAARVADAIAVGHALHCGKASIGGLKSAMGEAGIEMRVSCET